MKNENLEKYIGELSPELQEKARQCKTMEELQAMLAENDVELSEDAISAVAGGCSVSSPKNNKGDPILHAMCPECSNQLRYWDMLKNEKGCQYILRLYCDNPSCSTYNHAAWCVSCYSSGNTDYYPNVVRY